METVSTAAATARRPTSHPGADHDQPRQHPDRVRAPSSRPTGDPSRRHPHHLCRTRRTDRTRGRLVAGPRHRTRRPGGHRIAERRAVPGLLLRSVARRRHGRADESASQVARDRAPPRRFRRQAGTGVEHCRCRSTVRSQSDRHRRRGHRRRHPRRRCRLAVLAGGRCTRRRRHRGHPLHLGYDWHARKAHSSPTPICTATPSPSPDCSTYARTTSCWAVCRCFTHSGRATD